VCVCFFFSSRRRHTRLVSDWSSDVCSSDLATAGPPELRKDSYRKAADADLDFLRTRLAALAAKQAAGGKLLDGQIQPALGVSLRSEERRVGKEGRCRWRARHEERRK